MDYKLLNSILIDFDKIRSVPYCAYEKDEQDEGISYEIYKISGYDIYIKFKLYTSSYGEGDSAIKGIELVKPKVKQVTAFESL
jgi:hypothetical protein